MDIQKPALCVKPLKQNNLDESARVLARSFLMKNKIYSQYNLNYDEILIIMRGKIVHALSQSSSFVHYTLLRFYFKIKKQQDFSQIMILLILKVQKTCPILFKFLIISQLNISSFNLSKFQSFLLQKIISQKQLKLQSGIFYKKSDFKLSTLIYLQSIFINQFQNVDAQLQQGVDLKQIKKGEAIYNVFLVIDPDYDHKKYCLDFLWQALAASKLSGYKLYYMKIKNQQMLNIFIKLGASVVSQAKFQYKNLSQKYWVVKLDLKKCLPSHSSFKKLIKQLPIKARL